MPPARSSSGSRPAAVGRSAIVRRRRSEMRGRVSRRPAVVTWLQRPRLPNRERDVSRQRVQRAVELAPIVVDELHTHVSDSTLKMGRDGRHVASLASRVALPPVRRWPCKRCRLSAGCSRCRPLSCPGRRVSHDDSSGTVRRRRRRVPCATMRCAHRSRSLNPRGGNRNASRPSVNRTCVTYWPSIARKFRSMSAAVTMSRTNGCAALICGCFTVARPSIPRITCPNVRRVMVPLILRSAGDSCTSAPPLISVCVTAVQ